MLIFIAFLLGVQGLAGEFIASLIAVFFDKALNWMPSPEVIDPHTISVTSVSFGRDNLTNKWNRNCSRIPLSYLRLCQSARFSKKGYNNGYLNQSSVFVYENAITHVHYPS